MPPKRVLLKTTLATLLAVTTAIAGLAVFGAVLAWLYAPHYRHALAARAGQRLDAAVSIGGLALHWHGDGPALELDDVTVSRSGAAQPALAVAHVAARFSLADLVAGRAVPDTLVLDKPRLGLRIDDSGRLHLAHWPRANTPAFDWQRLAAMRQTLHTVTVNAARVTVRGPSLPGGRAAFEAVDARLRDTGHDLRWRLAAKGPAWLDRLAGHGRIRGDLPDARAATGVLDARGIHTPALARAAGLAFVPRASRLTGGDAAVHLRARWRDQRLQKASAHIRLGALAAGAASLPALSASLRAQSGDAPGTIDFALTQFDSALDGAAKFKLHGRLDTRQPAVELTARQPPTALAVGLARIAYPRLRASHIKANVDRLHLAAGRRTPFALGFDFAGLRIDDPALTAGPIAGRYHQQGPTHTLRLTGADGALAVKRYMRGTLDINDVSGRLTFRPAGAGWLFTAHELSVDSPAVHASTSGTVRLRAGRAPTVDLTADFAAPDMVRLFAHLPRAGDLPNPRLRDWLATAVKAGRLDKAHLSVRGTMDRFPFAQPRAGEGFHLRVAASRLNVVYKPGWPRLTGGRGTLRLDGDDLGARLAAGEMLDTDIGGSRGRLANVRRPVLLLHARVKHGRAKKMLAFLAQSPLSEHFGKLAQVLDLSGPVGLTAKLRIPLKSGLGKPQVAGTIDARGDTLRHRKLPAPITGLAGRIAFDKHGLTGHDIRGDLRGVALTARLKPGAGDSQRIVAAARLALPQDRAIAARYLPSPWLDYAHGRTDIKLDLSVSRAGRIARMALTSDMQGLGLDLPAPLAKPAAASAPLRLLFDGARHSARLHYDKRVSVRLRFADGHPSRMQVLLNDADTQAPDADGIWIGGHADRVDAPGWFAVLRHVRAAGDNKPGADTPHLTLHGGDMTIGRLAFGHSFFENTHVWADPLSRADGWRVNLDGPATQGQMVWRRSPARATLSGRLARLAIKTEPERKKPGAQPPPSPDKPPVIWPGVSPLGLPRVDIAVWHVLVNGHDFGKASIRAQGLENGWQLERAALDNGSLTGWATARWTHTSGLTRARGQTRLQGSGLAQLLRALGYPATLKAERARIHARLTIGANTSGLDLRSLGGRVQIGLDQGTLLTVDPGPARMLGLFNLYVLPRRLRGDFRDVTKQGLAFGKIRALFDLEHGNAYASGDDVTIDTPSSKIRISGRIGLAARDYDERVTIAPQLGSGVALAGALFGGPIVGAAIFALQTVLQKPIQKYSSIGYTLKGSWANPEIAQPVVK